MPLPDDHQTEPVLEMSGVSVASLHDPGTVRVDQVEWSVRAGQYWIVGGAPASGKSDLLTTAAGLMRPRQGSLRLFGRDVAHMDEEERLAVQLRIGVVFGYGGRLFNHLNVAENLALPYCYHHNCVPAAAEPRVQAILEGMELAGAATTRPMAANRNTRQRVGLARALVLSPEVLFLDNPLVGVDPREARWWMEFLEALRVGHPLLQGRPMTLVVGTDDFQPWSEFGHQFALIERGRFVSMGSWEELTRTASPALRELLPVESLKK